MAGRAAHASYQVDCPHCGKTFEGELLTGRALGSRRGFKCPHCRLFVPFERATTASPAAHRTSVLHDHG